MAKTLIVGNWKMHLNVGQASLFLHKLQQKINTHRDTEVVIAPNTLVLQSLSLQIDRRKLRLAAQNCYWRDEGAYTGEVSATMLHGLVDYIIVGHSERRHVFNESDTDIRRKVQATIRNNITPILCVGETAHERTDGETKHVLHDQLISGLANVTSEEIEKMVVAYEPVWAIGTGRFAKPPVIQTAVDHIREQIAALYGKKTGASVRVLYGGSVDNSNAGDFLKLPGVNGLLVGGASLKADVFADIIASAHNIG